LSTHVRQSADRVRLSEIRPWEKGEAPYIHVQESGKPGPTVMLAALTHGNEVSGAIVVDALLARALKAAQRHADLLVQQLRGLSALRSKNPFKSRMIDEDFNRTWGRLDQPATTLETRRAQVVRPFVERADFPARSPFHA